MAHNVDRVEDPMRYVQQGTGIGTKGKAEKTERLGQGVCITRIRPAVGILILRNNG
jgi:hypothetical protein